MTMGREFEHIWLPKDITFSGAATFGIAKAGTGSMRLGGANTFDGPVSVTGTLRVNHPQGLGLPSAARALSVANQRLELLAALECVDLLTVFSDSTVDSLLLKLKPHVHAKGTDYTKETVPERATVLSYGGEIARFTVDEAGGRWAVKLQGVSYIKVDGIVSSNSGAFFYIGYGACFNEISNCAFDRSSGDYQLGYITDWNSARNAKAKTRDNWLHHNTFSRYGKIDYLTGEDLGTIRISSKSMFHRLQQVHVPAPLRAFPWDARYRSCPYGLGQVPAGPLR